MRVDVTVGDLKMMLIFGIMLEFVYFQIQIEEQAR